MELAKQNSINKYISEVKISKETNLGVMSLACDPSTWEREAGGSQV
jgi:hypothetical protein